MPDRPGSIQSSTIRSGTRSFSLVSASSPRADGFDVIALGIEVVAQERGQRLFVFNHQNARAHG